MKINDVQVWHFTGGNKKIYDCVIVVSYHSQLFIYSPGELVGPEIYELLLSFSQQITLPRGLYTEILLQGMFSSLITTFVRYIRNRIAMDAILDFLKCRNLFSC